MMMRNPLSKFSKCSLLLLVLMATVAPGQTVIQRPGNFRNLPAAQIVPQALGASLAVTASSVYIGDGGYISAATTGAITVSITDGNGFKLAQSWSIAANQTVWLGQFAGTYMPGGITIACTGGAGACAAAHVGIAWYVAN